MLVDLVATKANEEAPHDAWLLEDLRHLGVPAERVMSAPSTNAIQSYVFWSSMLAEVGSPGFLGAAYALEFVSAECAGQAAKNLRERSAIGNIEKALSFLVGHAEADAGHIASLEHELGSVTDSADQRDIGLSCSLLCASYPSFFTAGRSDSKPRVTGSARPPNAAAATYEGSRR
jgi:pyrroloquinoline quinone (PQQ) biosynthesis protein C